eukprot:UN09701
MSERTSFVQLCWYSSQSEIICLIFRFELRILANSKFPIFVCFFVNVFQAPLHSFPHSMLYIKSKSRAAVDLSRIYYPI